MGLKVTGKKPVPVPELFLLVKIINAVIETAKEVEVDLKQEFDGKVKLDEMNMPDPLNLNNSLMRRRNSLFANCIKLLHYTVLDDKQ